jgi:hypothetical protein
VPIARGNERRGLRQIVPGEPVNCRSTSNSAAIAGGLAFALRRRTATSAGEDQHMNRRWFALGSLLALGAIGSQGVTACTSNHGGATDDELGTIGLPLGAYASSGTRYRLRNATFVIQNSDNYGYGGEGGTPDVIVVSSEDDPDADSINLSVERGSYSITLQSGWHMEQEAEDGSFNEVEALLLSNSTQWVYVSPRSTAWTRFNFGIGDREVWFNGNLNIDITVYEDPDDYYGGSGGFGATAGAPGWAGEGG